MAWEFEIDVRMRWVLPEGTTTQNPVLQYAVFNDDGQGRHIVQNWTTVKTHCVSREDWAILEQTGTLPSPPNDRG